MDFGLLLLLLLLLMMAQAMHAEPYSLQAIPHREPLLL
jgi:hypothetical protein